MLRHFPIIRTLYALRQMWREANGADLPRY